jgi:hypothetical protein
MTPLRSYLYGGLYGGLYESAHIIRYFPPPAGPHAREPGLPCRAAHAPRAGVRELAHEGRAGALRGGRVLRDVARVRRRVLPARARCPPTSSTHFFCLMTPLCSYLYGGLYGGCMRGHL